MRQCPRCTYPLSALRYRGAELDHCQRCNGTFLAPGEAGTIYGDLAEPKQWERLPGTRFLGTSRLRCATGDDMPMEVFQITYGGETVEVDVCPGCRGLWLDAGEGAKLYRIAATGQKKQQDPLEVDRLIRMQNNQEPPGVGSYIFQLLTSFPIEVWNPVRKKPLMTIGLVIFVSLFFLGQVAFLIGGRSEYTGLVGAVPTQILNGSQWWGVFSYTFFHQNLIHLIGNMYFLWIFGDNVEDALGSWQLLSLFVLSTIGAALLHTAFNTQSTVPVIGASGAVAGIMGAYAVLFSQVKVWVVVFFIRFRLGILWFMGLWLLTQFAMLWAGGETIAWLAHIGGFMVGVIFASVTKNRLLEATRGREYQR